MGGAATANWLMPKMDMLSLLPSSSFVPFTAWRLTHPNVVWANGMEGGHVHGREGVRAYWTRQWSTINPRVDPVSFSVTPEGEIVVEVHQVVHDLDGNLLMDQMVGHIFRIEGGLVRRFDIR